MIFNTYKLEELLSLKTQGVNTTTDNINYSNSGYKIVQAKNIFPYSFTFDDNNFIDEEIFNRMKDNHKLHKGEVLFTNIGSQLGNSAIYDSDVKAIITWNVMKLIPNDLVLNSYLCHLLNLNRNRIKTLNSSSTMPFVSGKQLMNIEFNIPDIDNQKKICYILDLINNKIKLSNEINNNLYDMCNTLYHQLLDANEDKVEFKTIGEISKKVVTGKTPSTKNKEYWDGNIPFITIPDMHNQVFTINTERCITREGAKSIVPKNSISVSCIATVGLVSISDCDSQTNQQINSIVIDNDYDLYYLFEFLSEQEQYMKSIAGGSTTYNINKNTFENIRVPYLPKELLIEYDEKVRPMFEKVKINQISNNTLFQLRDTLLPRLMNGEIDLDNIEI